MLAYFYLVYEWITKMLYTRLINSLKLICSYSQSSPIFYCSAVWQCLRENPFHRWKIIVQDFFKGSFLPLSRYTFASGIVSYPDLLRRFQLQFHGRFWVRDYFWPYFCFVDAITRILAYFLWKQCNEKRAEIYPKECLGIMSIYGC